MLSWLSCASFKEFIKLLTFIFQKFKQQGSLVSNVSKISQDFKPRFLQNITFTKPSQFSLQMNEYTSIKKTRP
jgi:hypothetical protein